MSARRGYSDTLGHSNFGQTRNPRPMGSRGRDCCGWGDQVRLPLHFPLYLNSGAFFSWSALAFMLACHFLSLSL
jgi:hypothetical protein